MSSVVVSDEPFETQMPLLIVGAGAAGLCAALAAKEAGAEPVVIERDAVPSGSTALSAGLIPAAITKTENPNKPGPVLITSQSSKDQPGADNYKYLLQPNLLLR